MKSLVRMGIGALPALATPGTGEMLGGLIH